MVTYSFHKNNVCVIQGHDAMKYKARGRYFRVGLNRLSKRESPSGVPGTCSPGKILKITVLLKWLEMQLERPSGCKLTKKLKTHH